MRSPAPALFAQAIALVFVALQTGCGAKIGDPCDRPFDCSTTQNRQCDLSNESRDPQGKGECTIENCTRDGCPKEAVCVKVYSTEFLSTLCDPELEDLGERDDCSSGQICLPEGLCADDLGARSSCRLECTKNRDCRDGYECRPLGQDGMYQAPSPDYPELAGGASICVPIP